MDTNNGHAQRLVLSYGFAREDHVRAHVRAHFSRELAYIVTRFTLSRTKSTLARTVSHAAAPDVRPTN